MTNNHKQDKQKSKHDISGILLLDKPVNMTSNAALQRTKKLYRARKAGHTGSLDPLASGMLPLCFGEATKFSQYLLDADKHYQVSCKLGITTTTGDAEGKIVATREVKKISKRQLEKILQQFSGEIEQLPSMYSAIKHQGEPLYKLARRGITVERKPRTINIYHLKILDFQKDVLTLDIHCSKGTYIRTLIEDIGEQLECGAYVTYLRRVSVGKYATKQMISLETIENLAKENDFSKLDALLLPIESIFVDWPELVLADATAYYLIHGQPVVVPRAPSAGWIKLKNKTGDFLGVGEILDDGRVAPRRLVTR